MLMIKITKKGAAMKDSQGLFSLNIFNCSTNRPSGVHKIEPQNNAITKTDKAEDTHEENPWFESS